MSDLLVRIARHLLPPRAVNWTGAQLRWIRARGRHREFCPPRGLVRFGSLRRLTPFHHLSGGFRGLPIDRYYIELFLTREANNIHGHVLEIGDSSYTLKFGGTRVSKSDVLHRRDPSPPVTILGDLTRADHIPSDTFDCIILTQTLQLIYDVPAALATLWRILKPGGSVLATVPGITPIARYDMDAWGQYWSFTSLSARRLFEEAFTAGTVDVNTYGNVLSATAFLFGISTPELRENELNHTDPDYELLITVCATKAI